MVALTLHFLDGGNFSDYSYFDILKDLLKFLTVQLLYPSYVYLLFYFFSEL
jgi:hypothetical protein